MFSFKLRGAYNKMAHLTAAELDRGVVCSSAGNHAQGVALAAQKLVRGRVQRRQFTVRPSIRTSTRTERRFVMARGVAFGCGALRS